MSACADITNDYDATLSMNVSGLRCAKKDRRRYGDRQAMATLTDTTLVILCPHCWLGMEYRPLTAYKDGRFVCRDCAHTVRPGVPEYRCSCRPCLSVAREDYYSAEMTGSWAS